MTDCAGAWPPGTQMWLHLQTSFRQHHGGAIHGELPGDQRSCKMQNMSLQTVGLVGVSLSLALPPVSATNSRNTLGDQLCLGGDTAWRKTAMSLGTVVSDLSGGAREAWPNRDDISKELVKASHIS